MPDLEVDQPVVTPDQKIEKAGFSIAVIEETHQAVFRRVAIPEAACCPRFEEEFGKQFALTRDGGVAPASLRIERLKLGKTVMDQPKCGWTACPFCRTLFTQDTQAVLKTSGD